MWRVQYHALQDPNCSGRAQFDPTGRFVARLWSTAASSVCSSTVRLKKLMVDSQQVKLPMPEPQLAGAWIITAVAILATAMTAKEERNLWDDILKNAKVMAGYRNDCIAEHDLAFYKSSSIEPRSELSTAGQSHGWLSEGE
jgi:hypothetical protein